MSQRLRCDIQYIFQDAFGALNPRKSVEQAIAEPMSIHGLHRGRDRRSAILKLLDEVGLASMHLDRLPHELSGGQRQRVTIARALALEPQVLICDEIVSALDVSVQAQILNLLKDLQELRGLTLIFISHDLSIVAHMCDAIAVMKSGKVVEYGQAETILKAPTESYTRRLLRAAELLELPPGGAGKGIPELSGLERESVGTVLRNPCAA
jgi:ABC-type glutathione transport system ATPase component